MANTSFALLLFLIFPVNFFLTEYLSIKSVLLVRGSGAKNGRQCAVRGKSMKLGMWLI